MTRFGWRKRQREIIQRLTALQRRSDMLLAWRYIDDMILYAMVGRDRKKLIPDEYVAMVEKGADEQAESAARMRKVFAPSLKPDHASRALAYGQERARRNRAVSSDDAEGDLP